MRRFAFALLLAFAAPVLFGQQAQRSVRFALSGDSILTHKISVHAEPEFLELIDAIRSADVAFTNLEMLFHDYEPFPSFQSGGTYMRADPSLLRDLVWAGFDLVSMANNHAVDYGIEGLRINRRWVRESGLVSAGVGDNLTLARAPGYLDSGIGRVALISCASTFPPFGLAGPARPDVRGRPGLNPLRFTTTYQLDAEGMAALRTLQAKIPSGRGARDGGGAVVFQGNRFEPSERPGVATTPDPTDLREITASIRAARKQADWVLVTIHCHESIPGERERPPQFLETFARASIDAGADMFVGHGPHMLKGIEIYKGKPIFYSLANFIFQNETVEFLPAENYAEFGLGPEATPAEFNDRRYQNDTTGFPADARVWESVVALPAFSAGKLQQIELLPITLGQKKSRSQRGRPVLAAPAEGLAILEHIGKLSAPYGVRVAVERNRGVIRP
jgi:poly-gamma-glutamate capsule biosynthesis protein CapA/YwtB (metallophosphatase superfamily)